MHVGIIGAGISGLTLAYELQKRGIPYRLFEAADRVGGYIQSEREGAYLREIGPNSLLGGTELLNWLDELGLTGQIEMAKPVSKARFIFRNGQYRELPSGPPALLLGSYFSWKTKWAIFNERNNKTTSPPGETLGQFFRRRFSGEIVDYALAPFVAGIYAGDPERLLVSETFPVLLQYEREYGSVLRGFIKNRSGERRQSFSFRDGMQTLPLTLAANLNGLSLNDAVSHLQPLPEGRWQVTATSGTYSFDKLVLSTPTGPAAHLLETIQPALSAALRQIEYPPMTAVHSAYKRADVGYPLDGFGGLNPAKENRFCAGHIWSSSIFGYRCPDDEVLLTTFVGGKQAPDNARKPESEIFEQVHRELSESLNIRAQAPVWRRLVRWEHAIPQYDANLAATKPLIATLETDNLYVSANWYGGISLPDCIRKSQTLAQQFGVPVSGD